MAPSFNANDALTARDYFAEKQNPGQTGAAAPVGRQRGGPIIKDKLHYFVNLERIDQNRGITINIPARPDLNFTTFTHDNVWNWMGRVDHQINANNTWAVRWLRETSPQTNQYPGVTTWTKTRAEEEQDTDWTIGNAELGDQEHEGQHLKISYTHEDVFFGNPKHFELATRLDARASPSDAH
jgi:hypothetical protein